VAKSVGRVLVINDEHPELRESANALNAAVRCLHRIG
jgi:hypothetical protein